MLLQLNSFKRCMVVQMSFNTVNGKYCCNSLDWKWNSIDVEKGFNTVNSKYCCNSKTLYALCVISGFNTVNGKYCCNVSYSLYSMRWGHCFNTVNGKYCCNLIMMIGIVLYSKFRFNTVNGKYCCNDPC